MSTQCKIAAILSAYDDLIENNLGRIQILEEMAQSLYREWFIKFHFPGHESVRMVNSPLGKIPEGWEVAKEGSMNVRGFLVGISIATIGSIIFILLPRIMSSMNILLIAGIFIGLLAAILIGFVFASVGVIPFLESFFVYTLQPFFRKYMNLIKISLKRNQRRNTGTIVMFAISFSFALS